MGGRVPKSYKSHSETDYQNDKNVSMASIAVVKASTVVSNKVTKTVSEKEKRNLVRTSHVVLGEFPSPPCGHTVSWARAVVVVVHSA